VNGKRIAIYVLAWTLLWFSFGAENCGFNIPTWRCAVAGGLIGMWRLLLNHAEDME